MLIGYAHVSTHDQNLDLQLDALIKAGCDARNIYKDTISGAKTERKGLDNALSHLRAGDILVVWRLDRLGRTLAGIELINDLNTREVGFRSLQENICCWTYRSLYFTIVLGIPECFSVNQ